MILEMGARLTVTHESRLERNRVRGMSTRVLLARRRHVCQGKIGRYQADPRVATRQPCEEHPSHYSRETILRTSGSLPALRALPDIEGDA